MEKKTSKQPKEQNPMRAIKIDKVTLNIGAGAEVENVEKAVALLEKIAGTKAVKTKSKKRIAEWKLRPGLPIGARVTLRKKAAAEVLQRTLKAANFELPKSAFTLNSFSFGIKEYIDIPGVKYDPKIGIIGLSVCVSLIRAGYRVKKRKIRKAKISPTHLVTAEDAMKFAQEKFGVKIKEEEEK